MDVRIELDRKLGTPARLLDSKSRRLIATIADFLGIQADCERARFYTDGQECLPNVNRCAAGWKNAIPLNSVQHIQPAGELRHGGLGRVFRGISG